MTTLERIRLKEGLVNKLLSITRTTELLNYWNATNGKPHDEIEELMRACIMDEMERRFPEAYACWRNEDADNDELSFYLLLTPTLTQAIGLCPAHILRYTGWTQSYKRADSKTGG